MMEMPSVSWIVCLNMNLVYLGIRSHTSGERFDDYLFLLCYLSRDKFYLSDFQALDSMLQTPSLY